MARRSESEDFERAEALYGRGDLQGAYELCLSMYDEQRPDHRVLHLMGLLAFRRQHFPEAQALLGRASELSPEDPLYLCNLALPSFAEGEFESGIEALDRALALEPGFLPAVDQKSAALMQLNRAEEARPLLEELARRDPAPRRIMSLALCLRSLGNLEEASSLLTSLVSRAPGIGQAWWLLAGLDKASRQSNHLEGMVSALAICRDAGDRVPLLFALAREHEDLGEYEQAFTYYSEANDLRRAGMHYEIEKDAALFAGVMQHETPRVWRRERSLTAGECVPIFVVSMPRTGSTLVERWLGAHSRVCAAGELQLVGRLTRLFSARAGLPYPDSLARLKDGDFEAMREAYLRRSRQWRDDSPLFVDKMPVNFLYLGVIARMFPEAPVIHVRRDPVDTCLSCYRQLFGDYYRFSYDLGELGRWYGMYRDLMEHWRETMPGRILDVQYEELVDDPEGQAVRLLAHCGLEWEPACLGFTERGTAVRTPSAAQVRRDVYQDSVGRWQHYADQLAPLLSALGKYAPT